MLLRHPHPRVHLARPPAAKLAQITGREIPMGTLDITMYQETCG
ncbi:hypothetical protein GCM10020229_18800 [Kitasatospora albolonga]